MKSRMKQHSSKCSARRHPPRTLGWGQKVAYLIKGDGNSRNVEANKVGIKRSKFNFFPCHTCLHFPYGIVLYLFISNYLFGNTIILLWMLLSLLLCSLVTQLKLVNVILVVYSKSKEEGKYQKSITIKYRALPEPPYEKVTKHK